MANGKKVIIAIPVLLQGGTEMQTLNLVRVLAGAGYRITVCCYHEHDAVIVSEMQQAGADVILMELERSISPFSLVSALRSRFKAHNPDIVHGQYLTPGFWPILAARLAGVKTVFATVHQPGRTHGWKAKIILRAAARLCTAFFCNSKSVEASWFGSSMLFGAGVPSRRRRHFTIYNAIDAEYINRVTATVNIETEKKEAGLGTSPVIGVVGRLRWEKGQAVLINAMPKILKVVPEVRLMIVGDGPDRTALEALCDELGISKNVVWLGQKNHEKTIKFLALMDVVAVPSLFEGFGLAAAEAMAAGKPVIASNVDGLCEIIDDGESGVLVPAGNSDLLGTAIITLIERPVLAKSMGRKGYTKVKVKFSLKGFNKATIHAYQTLQKR
jgi:glycosyltransferase involved in cell wall biosynthesis